MKTLKKPLLILFLLLTIQSINSQNKIGLFTGHTDVENPITKGFATYNTHDQTYVIGGSGKNMWGTKDEFHYLWSTIQGDFILRAEVKFIGKGVNPHRKVGWIVKNDLNGETPHVNATIHGDGLTCLQYRKKTAGITEQVKSTNVYPDVIQLERRGNDFIMSTAKFGEEFIVIQTKNLALKKQVFIGLYTGSHDENILETAKFRNVRITQPTWPGFRPYNDYLGSRLEIMEVSTGLRKTVYTTSNSIQAPNWTADGKDLIYNSEGRIYKFNLNDKTTNPLNTGAVIYNNNDHALSFDGSLIGLSSKNPNDNNNSTLYYLPFQGDSKPIAVNKPGTGKSYFHGWSPNNKEMLFTGDRNNQYDIFSIDIRTGKETQLTNQKTLDDGSEYSPDGKQIFFNSVRTGKMKLWKMDPKGKKQTQITFDEYNDWFPHVSPDQKWIVFISFPKDITPNDHPFYKHCLLRIMPYEGGTPKIIGYLYGGQGTINTPSWSPDSKYISFISNSKL